MSHRRPSWSQRVAPALLLGLGALSTVACRTDVDGVWVGTVGTEPARLSLEQAGSIVEGEVCIDGACVGIDDGQIVEGDLTLEYGCPDCALQPAVFDAVVEGGAMDGVVYLESCGCAPDGCDCSLPVTLDRAD